MKSQVILAIAFTAVASFAQTNISGKTKMMMHTGGYVFEPIAEDAKVVALIDKRDNADNTLSSYQTILANRHIASVIGDSEKAAIKLYLVKDGDLTVNLEKGTATIPVGKDAEETQINLNKAVMALFSAENPFMSQGGMLVAEWAMKKKNIGRTRRASYKVACEEGWAPAPTNDFQKAIWEKVKAEKEAAAKPAEVTETK